MNKYVFLILSIITMFIQGCGAEKSSNHIKSLDEKTRFLESLKGYNQKNLALYREALKSENVSLQNKQALEKLIHRENALAKLFHGHVVNSNDNSHQSYVNNNTNDKTWSDARLANFVPANLQFYKQDIIDYGITYPTRKSFEDFIRIENSLLNGSVKNINIDNILDSVNNMTMNYNLARSAIDDIYSHDKIKYTFDTRTRQFFIIDAKNTFPLLISSGQHASNLILAIAGSKASRRYAALGFDSFKINGVSSETPIYTFYDKLLAWLMKTTKSELSNQKKISLIFLETHGYSNVKQTPTYRYLHKKFPNWTLNMCSDVQNDLENCLKDSQLVITNWYDGEDLLPSLIQKFKTFAKNIPVLYSHTDWMGWNNTFEHSSVIKFFGARMLADPYNRKRSKANWNSPQEMIKHDDLKEIYNLLQHIKNNSFTPDLFKECKEYKKDKCPNLDKINKEFFNIAKNLRELLTELDKQGIVFFPDERNEKSSKNNTNYRLLKLLMLYGDISSKKINYPLDKTKSKTSDFLGAYLTDHLIYYHRKNLTYKTGDFSPKDNELVNLNTKNASIEHVLSEKYQNMIGTGFYALPGKSITLKRTSSQTASKPVGFFINTQGTGSTRELEYKGYSRPKFLQSPSFILNTGQTDSINSPYGGPIYIVLPSGSGTAKVEIDSVVEYPHLNAHDLQDNQKIEKFKNILKSTPFNWTGIFTDYVQINSMKDMYEDAIKAKPYNGNIRKQMDDLWKYMIQGTYNLAGFHGNGLSLPQKVKDYCDIKQWDCENEVIHQSPSIQHINIDKRAHCGNGCSGNPFDEAWPLEVIGWGESHEIGHNLQRDRLNIYGQRSGETSNNLFPMYKAWQYFNDKNDVHDKTDDAYKTLYDNYCKESHRGGKNTFERIKSKQNDSNPINAVYKAIWEDNATYANSSIRLDFYLQFVVLADKRKTKLNLDSGWQIVTLLYLQERLFNSAIQSNGQWNNNKTKLGFNTYASPPKSIDGNDFMLIALSYLIQIDMCNMFDLWGITYTDKAKAQVKSFHFTDSTEKVFYKVLDHCAPDLSQSPKLRMSDA